MTAGRLDIAFLTSEPAEPDAGVAHTARGSRHVRMRRKVYDAIVARLSDYRWHEIGELRDLTAHPEPWLEELARDRRFDIDKAERRMRLRASVPERATA